MRYLSKAFGATRLFDDPNAAVKFSLDLILMDRRFGDLAQLLNEGSGVFEVAGEPGYSLQRRAPVHSGGGDWPEGKVFRAFVEPSGYELDHPEGFYTTEEFEGYVSMALGAYVSANPTRAYEVAPVQSKLDAK